MKRDCTKVIYSPKDLLVWGLKRVLQAGTQQLRFFSGGKEMYLFPTLEICELIRSSDCRLSWVKQQLLLLLCLVSSSWCSCVELCTVLCSVTCFGCSGWFNEGWGWSRTVWLKSFSLPSDFLSRPRACLCFPSTPPGFSPLWQWRGKGACSRY